MATNSGYEAVLARLRKIVAKLPGTSEQIDKFGHNAFKVGKQSLALLGVDNEKPSLGLKTDLTTQAVLVKRGKFYKTPYVGQHGWVSIDGSVKQLDWEAIEQVINDTYRAVAPKKLLNSTASPTKGTPSQKARTKGRLNRD